MRLVKTENASACVKVNSKVGGNSGSSVLPVVPSCVNKVSIHPINQSKQTSTRDSIHKLRLFKIL
jgi:hypothetical protein